MIVCGYIYTWLYCSGTRNRHYFFLSVGYDSDVAREKGTDYITKIYAVSIRAMVGTKPHQREKEVLVEERYRMANKNEWRILEWHGQFVYCYCKKVLVTYLKQPENNQIIWPDNQNMTSVPWSNVLVMKNNADKLVYCNLVIIMCAEKLGRPVILGEHLS